MTIQEGANVTDERNYGAIFTRRWVVDLMLDTCDYTAERNLTDTVAVEPSCGDGAFLLPMVERLSASLKKHKRDLTDAAGAIKGFDLQAQHVHYCRQLVSEYLVTEGWKPEDAQRIAEGWVHHGDYLLTPHDSDADFVIGNPPYIRSDDMTPTIRAQYMERCHTMTVGADIFVGFIEMALRTLKPHGVLSYIVADRWMHNNYGKKLRRYVVDGDYSVEAVYELHGVNAFAEEVYAYPAITQIRRGKQGAARYAIARETFSEEAATRLSRWSKKSKQPLRDKEFSAAVLPDWFNTDAVWPSASPERLALLERLEEQFHPLESAVTGTKIGIGIATGADKVFVVHDPEVAESDRLLPLVVTDHVRRGTLAWKNTWLLNPWREDGSLVDLADYPKMANYLTPFKASLSERHTARKSSATAWFRTIDKVNPTLTGKPKLLLQDMKATIQPVYDTGDYYPHHNLYWITSEKWDMKVLGGLLLSRVAEMFVRAYGVKMAGGTLRFQAQYLRLIHVPDPASLTPEVAARLVHAFELRDSELATQAALVAYGLDELPD